MSTTTRQDHPLRGESAELIETFDGLVEMIRRGRFASETEVSEYLRSGESTFAGRMVYFAADAWREAGLF